MGYGVSTGGSGGMSMRGVGGQSHNRNAGSHRWISAVYGKVEVVRGGMNPFA